MPQYLDDNGNPIKTYLDENGNPMSQAAPTQGQSAQPGLWDRGLAAMSDMGKAIAGYGVGSGKAVTDAALATTRLAGTAMRQILPNAGSPADAVNTTTKTIPEKVGYGAGVLGQLAIPASEVAPTVGQALGSRLVPSMMKQRAGQLFDAVAEDAGNAPVTLQKSQDAALRLMDMQKVTNLGPTVNKFLNRVTKPNAAELTYNEARDFYSALSEMSWGDRLTLNPKVQFLARQMVRGLKDDIGAAADSVGQASQYYQAMGQYARAARLKAAYMSLPAVAYVAKKYTKLSDLLGSVSDIAGSVGP